LFSAEKIYLEDTLGKNINITDNKLLSQFEEYSLTKELPREISKENNNDLHFIAQYSVWLLYKKGFTHDHFHLDSEGFFWTTEKESRKAFNFIKMSIESYKSGVPLDEWVGEALSKGWKQPEKWKPCKIRNIWVEYI